MSRTRPAALLAITAALVAVICGAVGGSNLGQDAEIVRWFATWREDHPDAVRLLIILTHLGGASVLLSVALVAALLTAARRSPFEGLLLTATVLSGRGMVELTKWLIDRSRPSFDEHPVSVFSQSFPSGHAGNSMVTYLAIALIALPPRWRATGTLFAIILSLAIGATRPVLGVHWPSDVLGGWAFGIAWVLLCLEVGRRLRPS